MRVATPAGLTVTPWQVPGPYVVLQNLWNKLIHLLICYVFILYLILGL